jgi:H+/Cl- antiporter ClcA
MSPFNVPRLPALAASVRYFGKWLILGAGVGLLAGSASALFLVSLEWATATRLATPGLLALLPIAGFIVGLVYFRFAGAASRGSALVIEQASAPHAPTSSASRDNRAPLPLRMAPLVLFGTIMSHLFGGSAGREGTAVQMGASLADGLHRALKLNSADRRLMLLAGISGGFGSVFGTPIAGFVFALEVQSIGRVGYEGAFSCLVAALVGDLVTRAWGVQHSHYPLLPRLEIEPILLLKVMIAGLIFGLVSALFVELTHLVKASARRLKWSPLRPFAGGLAIIALTLLVGTQDYLGLSLPLITQSLAPSNGVEVAPFAFLLKLVFTAVTLGSGFMGGEVTPLFVIGSTLGYSVGRLLGVEPTLMAALGFVAVFAASSNTPLACLLMGVELFGGGGVLYLGVACVVAYLASGHRSIYGTQQIGTPKAPTPDLHTGESVEQHQQRRSVGSPPR